MRWELLRKTDHTHPLSDIHEAKNWVFFGPNFAHASLLMDISITSAVELTHLHTWPSVIRYSEDSKRLQLTFFKHLRSPRGHVSLDHKCYVCCIRTRGEASKNAKNAFFFSPLFWLQATNNTYLYVYHVLCNAKVNSFFSPRRGSISDAYRVYWRALNLKCFNSQDCTSQW